ncbi:unnamed protein product, partial [marine sediment metagenome]
QYPPPEGWQDHLRYKKGAKEVVTQSWPVSGETQNGTQVSNKIGSGEQSQKPLTTLYEKEKRKLKEETERGRGNSPERSGEKSTPSPVSLALLDNFPKAFGRKPNSREVAQLRDLLITAPAEDEAPMDQAIETAYVIREESTPEQPEDSPFPEDEPGPAPEPKAKDKKQQKLDFDPAWLTDSLKQLHWQEVTMKSYLRSRSLVTMFIRLLLTS